MEASSFLLFEEGKYEIIGASSSLALENNEILITEQHYGIHVYNVSDQKITKGWTVKPDTRFSCPTIQDPFTKQFFAVQNNKTLWTWSLEALDLERVSKKSFGNKNIFQLFGSKQLKGNIVIVFSDSSVSLCDSHFKQVASHEPARKSWQSEWAHVFQRDNDTFLILVQSMNGAYSASVYRLATEPEPSIELRIQHDLTNPGDKKTYLMSAAYDTSSRVLSLLWSNKSWEGYEYSPEFHLSHWKQPQKAHSRTLTNFKINSQSKDKKQVQCAVLHPSTLIIVGKSETNDSYTLTVWDTIYGTLQGSHELRDVNDANAQLIGITISRDRSFAAVVLSSSVVICPIYCPSISLLSALGKMQAQDAELYNPAAFPAMVALQDCLDNMYADKQLSSGETAHAFIQFDNNDEWNAQHEASTSEEINTLQQLTKSSTVSEFMNIWEPYIQKIQQKQIKLSPSFVYSVANRCIKDEIWSPLEYLIKGEYLSSQSIPELLPTLMEKNQLGLLQECLEHVVDLTASDVLQLLKYFISGADHKLLQKYITDKYDNITADSAVYQFINSVVDVPVPPIFTQQVLKNLTLTEVLFMLKYLQGWFNRHFTEPEQDFKQKHLHVPSLGKIITWLNMIMDSHFAELVLVKECHPIIREISTATNQQMLICEKLEGITGYLQQFIQKMPLPEMHKTDYTIEVLHL